MSAEKELKLILQAAREFAQKQLAPEREENDKYPFGPFFAPVVEKAFQLDFFHILLPQEMNGLNMGMAALSAVLENLSQEDCSLSGIIFTTTAAQEIMRVAQSMDALSAISISQTLRDFLVAMPVFNNPSEVNHLAEATQNGDGYLLSGKIEYLVLGNQARKALLPARVSGVAGYGFFLVDLDHETVSAGDPIVSLGLHACPAVDVELTRAEGILIGQEDCGEHYFEKMADRLHVAAAAMALGIMKGSFKEAFDYAGKREQGGQEIINWSEVKMLLAEMAIKITTAEMILAQAVQCADNQSPKWEDRARAAALHIQQMACEATTDGIQIMGGVGYMKDFGQEKRFRDAQHIQALLGITPVKKIRFMEKIIS